MDSFWAACEARGPLILEVEDLAGARTTRHAFDRPSLLVGNGPRADLCLASPDVSVRHAYLQVISGHLFCVDLDSRTGTHVDGGTALGGWVVPGQSVRIGPYRIRTLSGLAGKLSHEVICLSPLSTRVTGLTTGADMCLKHADGSDSKTIPIRRTLTLVGRSDRCKIRITSAKTSRFLGALLRTPLGLWIIDLRASDGVTVNGVRSIATRLEEGDALTMGQVVARINGIEKAFPRSESSLISTKMAVVQPPSPVADDLRPLIEGVACIQQQSSDQLGQMIVLLTQMFGSMHREMVELVREELSEVRRLTGEIQTLKIDAVGVAARRADETQENSLSKPPDHAEADSPRNGWSMDGDARLRDPAEVHLLVSERLAAFERERQGRWNKISKLLLK